MDFFNGTKVCRCIKVDDLEAALAQKVCKLQAGRSWQQIVREKSLNIIPFSKHQLLDIVKGRMQDNTELGCSIQYSSFCLTRYFLSYFAAAFPNSFITSLYPVFRANRKLLVKVMYKSIINWAVFSHSKLCNQILWKAECYYTDGSRWHEPIFQ